MAEWVTIKDDKFPISKWVEPVRCKDCKYWHEPDENNWGNCYEWGGYSQENDYCSWGERKDEDERMKTPFLQKVKATIYKTLRKIFGHYHDCCDGLKRCSRCGYVRGEVEND